MVDAPRRLVELPRDRTLEVRAVEAGDLEGLAALYEGLDEDARYRRFFSIYRPPRSFFEKLVTIRDRGGSGLVAVVREADGSDRVVGEAGYERLPNGDGELAITVDRAWRGWLGPYLLDALLEAADEQGVPNLEADVLCSNLAMLTLLRCRGYALMPRDDWSVVRLLVKAGDRGTPSWPGEHDRPRLLVEGAGGHWRGVDRAEEAGVQVLGCAGPPEHGDGCPVLRGEPCPLVEEADAILLRRPPGSSRWQTLRDAHRERHPDVPVMVELEPGDEARVGEIDVSGERPERVLRRMQRAERERQGSDTSTP